jgi:hypothetical protein
MGDSNEEMQLINDVAHVDSQLKQTLCSSFQAMVLQKKVGPEISGQYAFALRTVGIIRRNSSHVTACY